MANRNLQPMRSTSRRTTAAYPTTVATLSWDAPADNPSENMTQMIASIRSEDVAFSRAVSRDKYARGEIVATSEELARKMFVLMSGRVQLVCTNNEGRRLVIATMEPGAIFGEGRWTTQPIPRSLPRPRPTARCGRSPPRKPAT